MSETKKEYTHLEMEAALCVWEAINDRTVCGSDDMVAKHPELNECRENWGSVSLRHASIHIGKFFLTVYDLLDEKVRDAFSYDWEIIPAMLDHVDWAQPGEPEEFKFKPAEEIAADLNKNLGFRIWLHSANHWLKSGWSIDFTNGAGVTDEEMRGFYESGHSCPRQMAEWWAIKFDLDRTDQPHSRI